MKKRLSLLALVGTALLSLTSCDLILGAVLGGAIDLEGGDESLPISEEQAKKNMTELASSGYEIACTYYTDDPEEEGAEPVYLTYGGKDGIYWLFDDEGGTAINYSDDGTKVNFFRSEGEEWSYSYTTDVDPEYEYTYIYVDYWLYMGYTYDGMYKNAGSETVAGRSCTVYEYSLRFFSSSISYRFSVDNELGVTLKFMHKVDAEGDQASVGFETTSFKTGRAVTAPTLPAPEIAE